jgi:hypothetical protein
MNYSDAGTILGNLVNASGMNAVRTHERALDPPVKIASYPLQIGTPRPFSLIIGVTDVVANRAALPAYRTNPCHTLTPYLFNDRRR